MSVCKGAHNEGCTNEAKYDDLCEDCIDNRIDYLRKAMEQTEKNLRDYGIELYRLICKKPLPVKVCCKCKPIVYCIRHRKKGDSLESYCGTHLPRDMYKKQKNVCSLSEEQFRLRAGWPPKEKETK